MKIQEIYTKYKVMPFLQLHHFRVAAVASLICDNIDIGINKNEVTTACLLHDMGNIIKFKLEHIPEANEPEGIKYWQKVQEKFKAKWGSDENEATIQIVKEIGLSERILFLVDSIGFSRSKRNATSNDYEQKICCYSDHRVTPYGITSLEARMKEGRKRFLANKGKFECKDHFPLYAKYMRITEKQIFKKCRIKPKDINDNSIEKYFDRVKVFDIPAS